MTIDHLNMLYNIKVSFIDILEVGFNTIFIITLLTKPLSVASLMALY